MARSSRLLRPCRAAARHARDWTARVLGGAVVEARYLLLRRRLEGVLARGPRTEVAVCLHVFYPDKWELLAGRLAAAQESVQAGGRSGAPAAPFDLFVTLPRSARRFATRIRAAFPATRVVVVPNRGRGTLPFLKLAQVLRRHSYQVVLKLHCKKSGPGQDADAYLRTVLDRLLPTDTGRLGQMVVLLGDPAAALIGPSEAYLPLTVALTANKARLGRLLRRLCDPGEVQQVLAQPAEYGFFAGSMFWARLDALAPLLGIRAWHFEAERRQNNGTLPHALERAFSLLPRLQDRRVYEATAESVRHREPRSDNVPWWWSPETKDPG